MGEGAGATPRRARPPPAVTLRLPRPAGQGTPGSSPPRPGRRARRAARRPAIRPAPTWPRSPHPPGEKAGPIPHPEYSRAPLEPRKFGSRCQASPTRGPLTPARSAAAPRLPGGRPGAASARDPVPRPGPAAARVGEGGVPQRGARRLRRGAGGGPGRGRPHLRHCNTRRRRRKGERARGGRDPGGPGRRGERIAAGGASATRGAAAGQVPGDLACGRPSYPPPPGRDPGTGADRGRGADPEASRPRQPLAARPSPAEGKPPPVSAWRLRLSPAPLPPGERGRGDAEREPAPSEDGLGHEERGEGAAAGPLPVAGVGGGGRAGGRTGTQQSLGGSGGEAETVPRSRCSQATAAPQTRGFLQSPAPAAGAPHAR